MIGEELDISNITLQTLIDELQKLDKSKKIIIKYEEGDPCVGVNEVTAGYLGVKIIDNNIVIVIQ